MTRSAKEKADEITAKKIKGGRRGDRDAGRSKTPHGPKGGRNSGGRGRRH